MSTDKDLSDGQKSKLFQTVQQKMVTDGSPSVVEPQPIVEKTWKEKKRALKDLARFNK